MSCLIFNPSDATRKTEIGVDYRSKGERDKHLSLGKVMHTHQALGVPMFYQGHIPCDCPNRRDWLQVEGPDMPEFDRLPPKLLRDTSSLLNPVRPVAGETEEKPVKRTERARRSATDREHRRRRCAS